MEEYSFEERKKQCDAENYRRAWSKMAQLKIARLRKIRIEDVEINDLIDVTFNDSKENTLAVRYTIRYCGDVETDIVYLDDLLNRGKMVGVRKELPQKLEKKVQPEKKAPHEDTKMISIDSLLRRYGVKEINLMEELAAMRNVSPMEIKLMYGFNKDKRKGTKKSPTLVYHILSDGEAISYHFPFEELFYKNRPIPPRKKGNGGRK